MKAIIIEDEFPAADRLQNYLKKIEPTIEFLTVLDSVEASIKYFNENAAPDIIFSDIQLADGLSFQIFDEMMIKSPVIFITAYDEYAIKAFKTNSIDYLLKPVKQKDLVDAIDKYKFLRSVHTETDNLIKMQTFLNGLQIQGKKHKQRFLVKAVEQLIRVDQQDIAYFMAHNELVYLLRNDGKKFVIDYTLEQLEKMLAPDCFFRINRKMIAQIDAIKSIHSYFNGRLKVYLNPEYGEDVIVSREKASAFKLWMEGETE